MRRTEACARLPGSCGRCRLNRLDPRRQGRSLWRHPDAPDMPTAARARATAWLEKEVALGERKRQTPYAFDRTFS